MKNMRVFRFLKNLGLISRLMIAVGVAIVAGGGVQTVLLVAEGAAEHSARLLREQKETLLFLAPLVADQALVGDYAAITQLLKNQVKKGELDRFAWTDKDGKTLIAQDLPDRLDAPAWFARLALIEHEEQNLDVTAGGVGYGKLSVWVTPVKAHNRLWLQFLKQLQIVGVTLFLMLQFIWLIFRGNLGTLRMLAEGANRFSQGDHAVRINPEGAPEVALAAEAFNNMANNIEGLIASLGKSESKNKLLATIVEQSSEAIWTKDLAGIITSWNSGAAAMFGYPPADAVGRALNVGESTAEEEEARMQRLMAGEKFSYDARAMTSSGTAIDIQVAVAPLLDQANQWIGSISVARDVTQHKRSEEALRLAREAAESANHAKSSFLARMSHEIRTPMNGVLGMTELLLETGLTSAQRKYAETVQRSGQNLLGIINDLLDFSKIEAGKLELENVDMDLRRTLEDVVDLLAERAHVKGLELACSIPANLATHVKGDPLRLVQVLTNLVGNAIKFTEQGSVNLIALPTRLVSTWPKRRGSPLTWVARFAGMLQASSSALARARSARRSTTSSSVRRRSMSTFSSSSFPASILEKSRRSLMMPSRFWPERCTVSAYLRCALVSPVSSNSSVIPRTPFIGVRISWLILARNELFAWFADSAASRARRSASSLRLCCVTSRATEMLPIHWLASSSRGATAT